MKPYFLQKVITNPAYKRIIEDKAVGSTMPNLNVPIVSSLPIPLFPVEEQKNYISFIKTVESSKTKIKELQSRIEYLKASYMQEFFA